MEALGCSQGPWTQATRRPDPEEHALSRQQQTGRTKAFGTGEGGRADCGLPASACAPVTAPAPALLLHPWGVYIRPESPL